MTRYEIKMQLTRPAKSSGADRYEALIDGEKQPFVLYVLQRWSRKSGKPAANVTFTLDVED